MIWPLLLAAAVPAAADGPAPAPASAPAIDYAALVNDAIDGGRIIQAQAMLAQWRSGPRPAEQPAIEVVTARLALERHKDEEAAARFAALSAAGTSDCRADEGWGVALLRLGRAQEAVEPLSRAVAACANRWRAWNALGVAYDTQQAWARSSAAYERAFQLTDKPAQVLNNYGQSLLKQDQPAKAAAIFEKARELAPGDTRIIANLDAAYVRSGQEIARRPGDSADEWAQRLSHAGQVALEMGEAAKAQAYFSRAVTEADSFAPKAAAALAKMGNQKP
ncbi:tetratricopeptide repeat protein [Sphingobium bisphenolivorans]|uniref:tetratricopeptide repeat protein n=1 Tax=Sphingobium bisphenolivorans TaxID=1335760 RepID=UPI0003A4771D|nr:tetratricopeptide repeat protein [Sphingobium bisphenolivorans]